VSRRWNDVISGNDRRWKQIFTRHGFITSNTSVTPSPVRLAEPCIDCCVKPSSDDSVKSAADSAVYSRSQLASPVDDLLPDATDNHSDDFRYKQMFLDHKRLFGGLSSGQSLTTSLISGYSNRIMAIDYHNGYVATGMFSTVTVLAFRNSVHRCFLLLQFWLFL